jgi:hypothetical protein
VKRLLARTIWDRDSLPDVQKRFRGVFTIVLPLMDVLLVIFGLYGLVFGSKVVTSFTLPWFSPVWAACILVCALSAGIGLIFHRDQMEITAKAGLLVLFAIYGFLLTLQVINVAANSGLTIVLLCIAALIVSARIVDLVSEIAKKLPKDPKAHA